MGGLLAVSALPIIGKREIVQEPFRCTSCGAASATATRCPQCGGGAFELARVPARPDADEGQVAELLSLQAARAERGRRDPAANRD